MTAAHTASAAPPSQGSAGQIVIDFLFLDLNTCTRCIGTDQHLSAALQETRNVLEAAGRPVEVHKHLVRTEQDARRHRFVSSPTLRLNGRDLTVELTETSCGAEACADGCGAHVDCRVWTHQGEQYTEAPVALIVDALLREVYADPRPADPDEGVIAPYEVPENLQRFFRANQRTDVSRARPDATPEVKNGERVGCCSPADADACCDPAAKATCCRSSTAVDCGCR